jgi:hypothetical protein
MMGHGCVIESSGTFPNSRIYRPTCAEFAGMRGAAQNCQINAAQFCATLSTTGVLGEGEFGDRSAAVSQPSPASPIMTETLGRTPHICCEVPLANWTVAEAALHQ